MEIIATDMVRLGERDKQLFRNIGRILWLFNLGKQDNELVAPLPADSIRGAHASAQAFGNRLQQLITNGMPKRVIDVLERIQVDNRIPTCLWCR